MLHVVIDSTVLISDPARKKPAFRAVKNLTKARELQLHIPYVVEQEFLSHQTDSYSSSFQEMTGKISNFKKRLLPEKIHKFLEATMEGLTNLQQELMEFVKNEFAEWQGGVNSKVHPVSESHGRRVLAAYFAGTPPFKEKKRRKDIPDAFIWQNVVDIADEVGDLYVISSDKGILKACEGQPNITGFSSLEDFVSSDVCRLALKEAQAKANFGRLVELVTDLPAEIEIAVKSQAVDKLHGMTVNSEEIPEDNNEGMIVSVGDPQDIELSTSEAKYYGDGLVTIPVEFFVECLLDYTIFKGDFYTLSDEKMERISISEHSDHCYSAEEYYDLHASAIVAIDFRSDSLENDNLTDKQLIELLNGAEISLDSIEEIEIPPTYEY